MVGSKRIPWVLCALLDTEGDTAPLFVDIQHHDLDFVTQLHNLGGVDILIRPIHFRYVNQALYPFLDFGKTAVISQVSYLGNTAATLRVSPCNLDPRIFTKLLETE